MSWVTVNILKHNDIQSTGGGHFVVKIATVPAVPVALGRALLVTAMNGRTAFIYEDDNRNVALPNTSGSGFAFSYVNLVNLLQGMIERDGMTEEAGKVGYFNARFRKHDGKLKIDVSALVTGTVGW